MKKLEINMKDCFAQLRDKSVFSDARAYYKGEYRFVALLKERAKRAAQRTYDVIEQEMSHCLFIEDQYVPVEQLKDTIDWRNDYILDLGVYKGASTRRLASVFPDAKIHGFNSFEGLPANWNHAPKGVFGEIKGILPDVPEYVTLHKGWFSELLPKFREQLKVHKICLLRIDCDIYESAKTCLDNLFEFCADNCIIIFDEYFGYFGFKEHEYRAFKECQQKWSFDFEWKAYGLTYALLQLTSAPRLRPRKDLS